MLDLGECQSLDMNKLPSAVYMSPVQTHHHQIILYYTRICSVRPSVRPSFSSSVTLILPPLIFEMGWTGELWSKTNLLKWQNKENMIFFCIPKIFSKFSDFLKKKCVFFRFFQTFWFKTFFWHLYIYFFCGIFWIFSEFWIFFWIFVIIFGFLGFFLDIFDFFKVIMATTKSYWCYYRTPNMALKGRWHDFQYFDHKSSWQ